MTAWLLLLVMMAASLFWQFRHVRAVGRGRRAVLERVQGLLDEPKITQKGIGYPSMTGSYRGHPVRVHLVADNLTLRRLPRLWLAVSVLRPTHVVQPIDVQLEPAPTDIVCPGLRYRFDHKVPEAWPEHVRIATPHDQDVDYAIFDKSLPVVKDPSVKDIFIAPGGVRIVSLLAVGEVGANRLTRRVKFIITLKEPRLKALLDGGLRLAERANARSQEAANINS